MPLCPQRRRSPSAQQSSNSSPDGETTSEQDKRREQARGAQPRAVPRQPQSRQQLESEPHVEHVFVLQQRARAAFPAAAWRLSDGESDGFDRFSAASTNAGLAPAARGPPAEMPRLSDLLRARRLPSAGLQQALGERARPGRTDAVASRAASST